jgi:Protein of unknown function (DUF3999)
MNNSTSRLRSAFVRGALCVVALGLSLPAAAADAPSEDDLERYDTSVVVDTRGADALQRVRLPLEVLRRSRSGDLADLRVVDAQQRVLPMARVRTAPPSPPQVDTVALPYVAWPKDLPQPTTAGAAATQIEWTSDGSTLRIRRDAGGSTVVDGTAPAKRTDAAPTWLVDLQPLGDRRATALKLDWSSRAEQGPVRIVRVAASRDAQQWHEVGRAALVEWQAVPGTASADASRQVLQRRVALEGVPAGTRWLRVQAEGTLELTALAAEVDLRARSDAAQADAFDSARFPIRPEGFDLGASLALRRIDFVWPEGSTVVSWRLEREMAPHWHAAAQGTSWQLERGGQRLRSDAVDIDAGTARRWRVVALPQTPSLPDEVNVQWLAPQIVFVASGRGPYRLMLGRAGALDRSVQLATLIPGYRSGDEHRLPLASLGTIDVRPDRGGWSWADIPGQRLALWASLAAVVMLLAWMAWRLARDMASDTEPAPSPPSDGPPAPITAPLADAAAARDDAR